MGEGTEVDQILVWTATGYKVYPLLTIFGAGAIGRSQAGFGLSPLHVITQRGPLQDGDSAIDLRFDPRTIQVLVAERLWCRSDFWDRRGELLDLLRPNRSFDGTVRPLIYRKWLPYGKVQRGTDLSAVNLSATVTSHTGRFVERGLEAGQTLHIAGVAYTIASVPNDYTVLLTIVYAGATANNVHWQYTRGRGIRDLYVLLMQGPAFDEGPTGPPAYPTGYREALRFVANDPFWYGLDQTETWTIEVFGGLIFDATGSWTSGTRGIGRWLFGAEHVDAAAQIVYWGTAAAKPIITITGPAVNPFVENTTINTLIEMDYSIAAGETVTIDTLALTVSNNFGTNLLPYTTGDLATFRLSPPPQAPDRINLVHVAFSGGDAATSSVILSWKNRYVGI